MPKRGFADFISAFIRVMAVIYFLVEIGLFILSFVTRGNLDFGGLFTALLFTVMAFGIGILLDVALSIERNLYGRMNRDR